MNLTNATSSTPITPHISHDCQSCICPACYNEVEPNKDCKKCGQSINWDWFNKTK